MATPSFPPDDFPGSSETTGVLVVGQTATGAIGYNYSLADSDWFKVQLTAGERYVFSMAYQGSSIPGKTSLHLRDAAGLELVARDAVGTNMPTFEFIATTSGTYYLDVRSAISSLLLGQYAYTVSASVKPAGDDFAASIASAGTGTLGAAVNAVHETVGDADWFAYTFEAGKTYALSPATANGALIELSVYDSKGVLVSAPNRAFTPTESGKYFVSATAFKAGNYAFTVSEAVDDHAGSIATTSTLAPGGAFNATLDYIGDQDWFKVRMEANTFYSFDLDHLTGASGEALKLQLVKPDGSASDFIKTTDANGKAILLVRADVAGDYYANVAYGTYLGGNVAEQYTLKWSATSVLDEAGETPATARPMAIGTQFNAELTGTLDKDLYKFTLSKGVTYTFAISGSGSNWISPTFLDENGNYVQYNYADGTVGFTPMKDGVYVLQLQSYGSDPAARTAYTLTSAAPADDYAANLQGAGKLTVGSSITGALQPTGDRDWIGVDLAAGQTYWLTLSGNGASTGYGSATAQVFDANGEPLEIFFPQPGVNGFAIPTIAITPTASGTYYYEVSSYGDLSGGYKLTASVGTPDDAGNTVATAVQLQNNVARTGVLEVASDIDHYKVAVASNATYVVTLSGNGDAYSYGTFAKFYDVAGNEMYASNSSYVGPNQVYTFDSGAKLGSFSVMGFGQPNGTQYTVKAYSVADDYPANTQTPGAISINGSATGTIETSGDRDFFKVKLQAGIKYAIDLYGAAGGGGTIDATNSNMLSIIGADGLALTTASYVQSGEARMEFTPSSSGDYYVAVGSWYSSLLPATGSYRVAVSQLTGDMVAPSLVVGVPPSVTPSGSIYLGFNEQVKVDGNAFTLRDSSGQHVLLPAQIAETALHHVVTVDPTQFLQPGRSYTLELAAGGVRDLAGNAYAGQSSWTFTTPAAASAPTAGNDLLVSAGKGSVIDGGAGIDTVFMPGVRSNYLLHKLPDGRIQVQPVNGNASEVLSNVERVFFTDQAVALDIGGNGGQAYRLYRAAFDRAPDVGGVGYWTGQLDKGMSAKTVAENFLSSAEFITRYGSATSNAEFVNLLYQNVLHRQGDAGGIAYWNNMLDNGYSRADTLLGFSDSPENQAVVATLVGAGFEYTPL